MAFLRVRSPLLMVSRTAPKDYIYGILNINIAANNTVDVKI